MNPFILAGLLIFAALVLAIFGFSSLAASRRERRRIVEKIQGSSASQAPPAAGKPTPGGGSVFTRQLIDLAAAIGLKWGPAPETGQLTPLGKQLLQAGFHRQHALAVFFGCKIIGTALFTAAALLARLFARTATSTLESLVAGVAIALLGWYLPDIVLRLSIAHRKELLLEGFPDALDLMVVCVEAGMGLDAAVARVGAEIRLRSPKVAEEFHLLSLELRGGKMRRDALHNLATRTGLDEISAFTSLLVQTDRFGTSVAQSLRVHADSMRIQRAQRAEELAAKLPVKLVFPLILFIFPAIFVVVVGPAAIKVYRSLIMTH